MKTIRISLLTLSIAILASSAAFSQAFEQGKSYVSLSYGYEIFNITNILGDFAAANGADVKTKKFGPMSLKYEYAISDKIGIGASFGYTNTSINGSYDSTDNKTYTYKIATNKITAKARLNWHLADHDKLDPYIGFGFGYKSFSGSSTSSDPNVADEKNVNLALLPVSFEATFGIRYLFTPSFGAFGELGIGHGVAHIGLVGKF